MKRAGRYTILATIRFIIRNPTVLVASIAIVAVNYAGAWYLTSFTSTEFSKAFVSWWHAPALTNTWSYIWYGLWWAGFWAAKLAVLGLTFYLAFLLIYILISPVYSWLSRISEKKASGTVVETDFSIKQLWFDLKEALKIGMFSLVLSLIALAFLFVPVFGSIASLIVYLYTYAVLFLDYVASRKGLTLRQKLHWTTRHPCFTATLGWFPALLSYIPIINQFMIAIVFPFFVIYATLNFMALDGT